MFCPYCGTNNDEGNRFCLKCGQSLHADTLLVQPGSSRMQAAERTLPLPMLLAAILLVAGVTVIAFAFQGGQPVTQRLSALVNRPTAVLSPTPTMTAMPPTATYTAKPPTLTPIPPTLMRTLTPVPTDTPTPRPAVSINTHFRADESTICSGRCTTLRWDVDNVRAVYLDWQGQAGHGSKVVCPGTTQTYTLRVVLNDGREQLDTVTVSVSGQCAGRTFAVDYKGCIGHDMRQGSVKGQVLDKGGGVIPGARVEILLDGARWNSPANPAVSNGAGWYEWVLTPGQKVRFVSLTVGTTVVTLLPANFEVVSTSGCFQHVNFREQ